MRSAESGVRSRRQIAEPAVWPDRVVVILKGGELLPRMGERGEQRLIEQLVTKPPVEALDESILDPSVDVLDEGQLHASWVGPHIQDLACKLGPIIYHQDLG